MMTTNKLLWNEYITVIDADISVERGWNDCGWTHYDTWYDDRKSNHVGQVRVDMTSSSLLHVEKFWLEQLFLWSDVILAGMVCRISPALQQQPSETKTPNGHVKQLILFNSIVLIYRF